MTLPVQIEDKLHVLDIPTTDDVYNLISNGKNPENVRMLVYWIQKIEEKARLLGTLAPFYEDVFFLGAIEWQWFLKELRMDKC